MDQEEEKPKVNDCLMDALGAEEHAEWLEHKATKLLIAQLKLDCKVARDEIVDRAKAQLVPNEADMMKMGSLGAQLLSREGVLEYIEERSNG